MILMPMLMSKKIIIKIILNQKNPSFYEIAGMGLIKNGDLTFIMKKLKFFVCRL